MENFMEGIGGGRVGKALSILLVVLSLFVAVKTIATLSDLRFSGDKFPPQRTISVSGEGETFAKPDIAMLSLSVEVEKPKVKDAQDEATKKMNDVFAFLKKEGIEEKDIKTTSYTITPLYDYHTKEVICQAGYCPPVGKQVLRGYQVMQSLSVKVRDTDKTGEVLAGVGELGITNVYGPDLSIDDEDALRAEVRKLAIEDARAKAKILADDLGVTLVRVISFSEGGSFPPFYKYGLGGATIESRDSASIPPEIPVGENKITANVTVTYEIR